MTAGRLPDVKEIDAGVLVNEQRFRLEVIDPCVPVVMRGAFAAWPVVRAAEASAAELRAYIARFANDRQAEAFVGQPSIAGRYSYSDDLEGFNFERVNMDLLAALDRIIENGARPGSPTMYVGSLETEVFLPGFGTENVAAVVPATVSPRIWIGNASTVACHNDTFDNVACVVSGRREFTLYPPDCVGDLYVGPIDHTMAGRPVSLAASSAPGDTRFPRFAAAAERASIARLQPGDALYLPKLWWHQVEASDSVNVLVNYWWDGTKTGPDTPDTAMMLAMIAIAERPPAERHAWQALFEHYVFRPEGHPLAHLPATRHGILERFQNGSYGRIRALVLQRLRGG
jgi:hypothetical protein